MLLGKVASSLLKNLLKDKEVIQAEEGTITAGQNF